MMGFISANSIRKIVIAISIMMSCVVLSLYLLGDIGLAQGKPWEKINWDRPKPWPERLLASEYILPEGWEEATKGVKKITFFNSGGLKYDIATAINMKIFEKLTGIKVVAVEIDANSARAKGVSTLVAKDTSIDAVLVNSQMYDLSSLATTKRVEPVDFMWPNRVLELYNVNIKDGFSWEGHWYALPMCYIGHADMYRPSWLKKAGIKPPRTYQEYYEAAKKVGVWAKKNLGNECYGLVFSAGNDTLLDPFVELLMSQGGLLYENGRYNFDSKEAKNAFAYLVNAVKEGVASKEVLNYKWTEVAKTFGMGKAGFVNQIQPSFGSNFKAEYPEVGDDFKMIAPLKWSEEYPDEYEGKGALINVNCMLINRYVNDNQKAAVMLFGDYLRSSQAQRYEVVVEGNQSCLKHLWENLDEEIRKIDWKLVDSVADELEIARPVHVTSVPYADLLKKICLNAEFMVLPPSYQKIGDEFVATFGRTVLGKMTIDEAMRHLQAFADKVSR